MAKYKCLVCGYIYDEEAGDPGHNVAPGTTWSRVPENWVCPICGVDKSEFEKV
jgi:rubredoxin